MRVQDLKQGTHLQEFIMHDTSDSSKVVATVKVGVNEYPHADLRPALQACIAQCKTERSCQDLPVVVNMRL